MKVPKILLHKNGPEVSRLVYGIWRMHEDPKGVQPKRILEKVETCLSLGIDTFDHADIYGGFENEELFGKALSQNHSLKDQIKIVSKCGIQIPGKKFRTKHYNTSSQHIRYSVERSLKKLGIDFLDLLLIHRPDPLMDPREIADSFLSLKGEGKVKFFGVSNFTTSQFQMLQKHFEFPLVTNQVEFHPYHLNPIWDGVFDQMLEFGISPMIWSPTAGGRVFAPKTESEHRLTKELDNLGAKYGASRDQILYSWYGNHPAKLIPVLGTNDETRIQSAAACFQFPISREEWFSVLEAARGHEVA